MENIYHLERNTQGHIQWKQNQINFIINEYLNHNVTMQNLAKKFSTRSDTIKNMLIKNNCRIKTQGEAQRLYHRNSKVFNSIDTIEKAYWLGMLYADGNITIKPNILMRLALNTKDEDHLIRFSKFLETNRPISYSRNMAELAMNDREIVQDLINLGCVPNKTFKLNKVPIIPNELIKPFILGYFDSDGSICYSTETYKTSIYKKFRFTITGNYDFLKDLANYLAITNKRYRLPA